MCVYLECQWELYGQSSVDFCGCMSGSNLILLLYDSTTPQSTGFAFLHLSRFSFSLWQLLVRSFSSLKLRLVFLVLYSKLILIAV